MDEEAVTHGHVGVKEGEGRGQDAHDAKGLCDAACVAAAYENAVCGRESVMRVLESDWAPMFGMPSAR
eukprot:8188-Eustigmatos_ZCMA.PRE.1